LRTVEIFLEGYVGKERANTKREGHHEPEVQKMGTKESIMSIAETSIKIEQDHERKNKTSRIKTRRTNTYEDQ
jgi:hypothetical protein